MNPGGKLYVRTDFLPAPPDADFWHAWEAALSSIDEAMGWYHSQMAARFKEGYVEVFPRPTWFSAFVDLKAICDRQVPDPGMRMSKTMD